LIGRGRRKAKTGTTPVEKENTVLDKDGPIYQYLRDHLTGASAKSIAAHLGGSGKQDGAYPHDADDFARCEALLDAVPEFRARLSEMAQVNAYWAELVPNWNELRKMDWERDAAIKVIVRNVEQFDHRAMRMPSGALVRAGSVTFSHDEFKAARAAKTGKPPMKADPDFDKMANDAYSVTADELRQFIERFEHLEAEKKDIADQQKEVMAEAKGRGYDVKVLRKIIALRKRKPDDIAEEEAVLDLYKSALGMA
jgi:uncharacterized protein (UPF0335 family)